MWDDFDALWEALGVGPVPVWLQPDEDRQPDAIMEPLLAFLNAQSLGEMRQILEANPPLLTDAVEPALDEFFEQYKDDESALQILAFKRQVLRDCREYGVEVVFAALAQAREVGGA